MSRKVNDDGHHFSFTGIMRARKMGQRRIAVGLSLERAAELLGIEPTHLADIESRKVPLNEHIEAKMVEVYGLDKPPSEEA